MLTAKQFKVNRSNLESGLPLRGGALRRPLAKPRPRSAAAGRCGTGPLVFICIVISRCDWKSES